MFKGYIENLFNAKKGDIGFVQISHVQNWLPGFLRFLVNIHNLNHYKQFSWRYLSWKLIQAIDVKSTRNWDFLHGPQIAFSQTGWHVPACKPLDMVKLHSILFRAFGNNFSVSCIVLPLNCVWPRSKRDIRDNIQWLSMFIWLVAHLIVKVGLWRAWKLTGDWWFIQTILDHPVML